MITYGVINGLAQVRGISFTVLDNTVWDKNKSIICNLESNCDTIARCPFTTTNGYIYKTS